MFITVFAVVVANVFAAVNQIGWVLQKISQRPTCKYPKSIWMSGFTLMIAAALIQMTIMPFADLTLLSTKNATGIIAGVMFGIFWLNEPFNARIDLPALTLMIGGCFALGFVTSKDVIFYTQSEVRELMTSNSARAYYAFTLISVILTIFSYRWLMSELKKFENQIDEKLSESEQQQPLLVKEKEISSMSHQNSSFDSFQQTQVLSLQQRFGDAAEVLDDVFVAHEKPTKKSCWGTQREPRLLLIAVSALTFDDLKKLAPGSITLKRFQKIPLVVLLTFNGCIVGLNQVQLKIIGLFAIDEHGWEWKTVILFIITALQAFGVVCLMNLAMAHYPQLDVIPIYESLVIALTIACGMIFFEEAQNMPIGQLTLVIVSGLVIIVGILIISLKAQSKYTKKGLATPRSSRKEETEMQNGDTKNNRDDDFINTKQMEQNNGKDTLN